ncbi:MAG: glycosyltransferase [Deltaproteobacteria bacterium]|nr:glycosyltransferase [Deltaproteobacteria bacterium]MBW1795963.1 glycosyltransferase [Deltaproteobacteria bacterium]
MTSPKVSVIMSVYNGEPYLREAVESILNQTFTDFEFIIIDDGSTGSTREILSSYDDPRIRLVDNGENIGLTKSLNKGMVLARGEYVARQDADDVSLPERLASQVHFLADHPEVGVLGTAVKIINSEGEVASIGRHEVEDTDIRFKLLRNNSFAHGSVMFSRIIFERVGGYDENLGYTQDYDLWWRMSRHTRLANLSEPLYCWRKAEGNVTSSRRYEQAQTADRISVRNCLDTIKEILEELKGTGEGREFADASAIICTKDRYSDVVRCICHVLKQDVMPREIVIVDASKDNIVEAMVTGTLFDVAFPVIRHIRSKPGLTYQKNLGIRNSTSSIILFLDDDILLYPEFLHNILRVFDEAPGPIGGVTGNIVNIDRDEKSYCALLRRIFFSYGFGDGSFKRSGAATYPYGLSEVKEVEFLCGGQTAYRREVCEEFWFEELFFEGYSYLEDVEFSYRVSRKYKNYYTPYAPSFHNNKTPLKQHHPDVYRSMKLRNHKYHFRKNVPKSLLNWVAFSLCVFHIKHQRKLESLPDPLGWLKCRFLSAISSRIDGDPL